MTLAVTLGAGDAPPSEFRLFVAGWNDTENGRFLFDDEAAKATMAAYAKWGVDLAIDLEHQMLVEEIAPDPTAKDARGWCSLELRADGSLWAVNVTWTADGAARLSDKRQRYVSPAFCYDTETSRVTALINVAITAMPATHNTPALMAASRGIATMAAADLEPKNKTDLLDAVMNKDAKKALLVCQQILAELMGTSSEDAGPPDDAPPPDAPPPDAAASVATNALSPDTMAAAGRMAIAMTGKADAGEAMAELARRSKVAVEIEQREAQLSADRSALDASERDALTVEIAGVMSPGVAWADPLVATNRASRKPASFIASMPIAELRSFVAKLKSSAPRAPSAPKPPTGPTSEVAELSAREVALCASKGIDPVKYLDSKNQLRSR